MIKNFTYIKGASIADVQRIALNVDAGSRTSMHDFVADKTRVWILRELDLDSSFRFLECFDFSSNRDGHWGFRGWSEEEDIPHTDCPLDLLSLANGAINDGWRKRVYAYQSERYALPVGSWLHSTIGVALPDSRHEYDFQFVGMNTFRCTKGLTFRIPATVIARILGEGYGIALGRC